MASKDGSTFFFTSESVNEGHPDKLADQVRLPTPRFRQAPAPTARRLLQRKAESFFSPPNRPRDEKSGAKTLPRGKTSREHRADRLFHRSPTNRTDLNPPPRPPDAQISDAVLDACLAEDPDSKVACETATKTGMVMVFGEITTKAKVDYEAVVRKVCNDVGFTSEAVGLDGNNCRVLVELHAQSPEIGQGVHGMGTKALEEIGAGDQGIMFGYATDESEAYAEYKGKFMPMTLMLANAIGYRLTEVRKNGTCPWVRPDGKTQVTIEYKNEGGAMRPQRVHTVLISTQHDETVDNEKIAKDLMEEVIKKVIPA